MEGKSKQKVTLDLCLRMRTLMWMARIKKVMSSLQMYLPIQVYLILSKTRRKKYQVWVLLNIVDIVERK